MHYLQSWYTWQAKLLHVNFLVHRQFLRRLRQISCMIRTGIRRYQGKARGSATLPPLISPRPGSPLISWSRSKLEINIASAFMIVFSIIFSFHDICDIIIISPNFRSPALPFIVGVHYDACVYEILGHTSLVCKFWISMHVYNDNIPCSYCVAPATQCPVRLSFGLYLELLYERKVRSFLE